MGYGRFVGRVGALAVALGVGAAVATTPGIASAEPDSTSSNADSSSADSSSSDDSLETDPSSTDSPTSDSDDSDTESTSTASDDGDGEGEEGDEAEDDDSSAATSTSSASEADPESTPPDDTDRNDDVVTAPENPFADLGDVPAQVVDRAVGVLQDIFDNSAVRYPAESTGDAPSKTPAEVTTAEATLYAMDSYTGRHRAPAPTANTAAPQHFADVVTSTLSGSAAPAALSGLESASTATQIELSDAPTLVQNVFTALVAAAIGPLAGQGPLAPVSSPVLWTLLAAARREFERFQRTFFNHTPDVRPQTVTVELDDPTDISEEFEFDAVDRDGDDLTYHVPPRGEPGGPQHGTLTIDQDTGAFTYDPDDDFAITGGTETIVVTVTDHSDDQFHFHGLASLFGLTRPHRDSATVTITVKPTAAQPNGPDASPDAYSTDEDTPLTVAPGTGVLANDTGDGDLTAEVTSGPSNGALALNADGSFTYTPNANYAGSDSFSYTVSDGSATDTATVSITVNPTDDPVTAANDTATVNEDGTVTIDVLANDSVADGGSVITVAHASQGTATVVDGKVVYTPAPNTYGLHKFAYTVTDADGDTATAAVTVNVTPTDDPVTAVNDTTTVNEDGDVTINVLTNDTVPDGGATITITDAPANGTAVVSGTRVFYTPNPGTSGTDTFTYTVTDQDGDAATATVSITITAVDDPVTAEDDEAEVNEDSSIEIDVLANDSAPDGGATITDVTLADTAQGSAQIVDGKIVYTPTKDSYGTHTLTYTVTDADGDTDTATVTVTVNPTDDPVTATTDAATTNEDTPVTIDVLANDTAPDGSAAVLSVSTDPRQGTAVVNTDGTITYTPNPNTYGPHRFAYTVQDADGDTSTAIVNITVTPTDDAVTANDDEATVDEDGTVTIDVLANDTAPDGGSTLVIVNAVLGEVEVVNGKIVFSPLPNAYGTQTLIYRLTDADGDTDTAEVTITITPTDDPVTAKTDAATTNEETAVTIDVLANDSVPDGGAEVLSVTADPRQGTAVINTDGTITYTPNPNTFGPQRFLYTVRDADGDTSTAIVNITVTPTDDPVTAEDDTATVTEDGTVEIDVLANDSTPDGGATITIDEAVDGTATVVDGKIVYTPTENTSGTQTLTYTVTDADGDTDTATVTITVNPSDDPVTANDDEAEVTEDGTVTIDVLANDTAPDGSPTVTIAPLPTSAKGVATVNSDGTITFTPYANANGTQTVTYTVTDADGDTDTATLTITITPVDDALIANNDALNTTEDTSATVNILANDTYADGLSSVTIVSQPSKGTATYNPGTGVLTYKPYPDATGADTIVYRLTDADGDQVDGTVKVTIQPMNDPVIANDDNATTNEDTAVTVNVLANDSVPDGSPTVTIAPLGTTALGTAVVNSNGTITFTPFANANGTQNITYSVKDIDGSVDTGLLTVTIAPVDEPVTANADTATTDEDTPVTVYVLANDSVPDGSPVVTAVSTDPNQGTAVINANGTITYTPKANTYGPQKFTYTVRDADGDFSTATVTVTVNAKNDAPTADPSYGPADNLGVITGDINAADADNDNLSYDILSEPTHGTLEFDETTGEFTYTPDLSQQLRAQNTAVTDSFDVIVNDGNGGLSLVTVDIAVPPASATVTDTVEIGNFSDPWGIVVHPTAPRAYVAVGATDSVEVIDTTTNEIIDTISVGNVPIAVTMNADGSRLYVTNSTSRTVSVIDTTTNKVIATVNTGTGPGRAIVAPNGYLYVANSGGAAVTVIDTATNTQVDLNPTANGVQSTIPVGNGPRGLALSPDGSRLYVASTNDDTVTVINTATNTVIDANGAAAGTGIATGGDQPVDAVMSADGRYLYVSNQSDDYMTIIDTTDYSVEHVDVGGNQSNMALSPDGTVLYITMLSDEVLLFDTATNEVIGSVDGEEGTRRIDVSPDGRYVYVANGSGTVSVITVAREGSAVV